MYKLFQYKGEIPALQNSEFREALRQKAIQIDSENKLVYQDMQMQKMTILKQVDLLWSKDSNQWRYIWKQEIEPPKLAMDEYRRTFAKYERWQKSENKRIAEQKRREEKRLTEERRKAIQRQKAAQYRQHQNAAVETLEANGYKQGKHFGKSWAITFAKQVLIEISPGVYGNRMLPQPGQTHEREY